LRLALIAVILMVSSAVQAQNVLLFNKEPLIIHNALYVPVDEISTALNIEIKHEKNKIVLTHSNIALQFSIGKCDATLMSSGKTIDLPFRIFEVEGEVFAPVRIIADTFNLQTSISENALKIGNAEWTLAKKGRIVIDLRSSTERFYFYDGVRYSMNGLVSGARSSIFLKRGETKYILKKKLPNGKFKWFEPIHNHYGIFPVDSMAISRWSKEFSCELPFAIHIEGGHYFHVGLTYGYGASHGCVRRNKNQGKSLYDKAYPYFKSDEGLEIWII
jgi:hypothetical protein